MKSRMMVLLMLSFFNVQSFACTIDGKEGFAPENKQYIPKSLNFSGITEDQFNEMIDRVSAVYAPIIQGMGATLNAIRDWNNGTVNAYASRSGDVWNVRMFGGLARHKEVTVDGFALVMCHEVGHHVGGAPKYDAGNDWASNEGQADYFGTLKCFRKVFENENNKEATSKMDIPNDVKKDCKATWGGRIFRTDEYYLCLRSSMAGKSLANLLAQLGSEKEPKFNTPDSRVVNATNDAHPAAQCRLDTYYNGSLCLVPHSEDVDDIDETIGTCHQSTTDKGVRPLCWFKPTL